MYQLLYNEDENFQGFDLAKGYFNFIFFLIHVQIIGVLVVFDSLDHLSRMKLTPKLSRGLLKKSKLLTLHFRQDI